MDRTGIIVVAICFVLLGFWLYESEKLEKRQVAMTNSVTNAQSPAPAAAPVSPVASAARANRAPSQPGVAPTTARAIAASSPSSA